jgi:arsenite methyltransferase
MSDAYDELPLWSAFPGQLLLENIPFAGQQRILDLGFGTGFPLLLLARRFGPDVEVFGADTWEAALERAARKCEAWGLHNVTLLLQRADHIDLPSQSIDLITSNLGLNNFQDVSAVMAECRRLLRPDGRLCISTNLRGTFAEYYAAFEAVSDDRLRSKIQDQAAHRQDIAGLCTLFETQGFAVVQVVEDRFTMTYADGSAFLRDYFIGMGFLPDWKALIPEADQAEIFAALEAQLNAIAATAGSLRLTVPIAFLELQLAHTVPSQ